MSQTLTRLLVHAVWSTKLRRELITPDIQPDLFTYIGGICRNLECPLIEIGGVEDHIHVLFNLSKNLALAEAIMHIKKDSSKWIKPRVRGFGWQDGYGGFTIGASQVPAVRRYIKTQRQHHTRMSFQDELLALLRRYKVDYDPRYIWT